MNLKQLEAFVYVADTGSFSGAAKELFLTQPTVSSHIAGLEKDLNARLLARNTRKVQLTEKGKVLYDLARKMLEIQKDIEKEFAIYDENTANEIRIAASTIPAQYVLPGILAAFAKEHPGYTFTIREGDSADVLEWVSDGKADIGFAGTRAERDHHCKDIPFYRDELVILTPVEDRFQKMQSGSLNLHILYDEPVILREEGSGTRKEAEKHLTRLKISLEKMQVVASMSSQEAIKNAVSSGMGITIISEAAAKDFVNAGKALSFSFPGERLYRDLQIIFSTDFRLSEAAQTLVHFAQDYQFS